MVVIKMDDLGIIGYTPCGKNQYRVIPPPMPGMISTAAVRSCSRCGTIISGMGGPGNNCLCPKCFDQHRVEQFALGNTIEIVK